MPVSHIQPDVHDNPSEFCLLIQSKFKIHQIKEPYSYLPLVYISLMYTILIIITFILYHFTLQHKKHFTKSLTTNQSLSGCYPVKENFEVLCWLLI
jgi:hypothetical protein